MRVSLTASVHIDFDMSMMDYNCIFCLFCELIVFGELPIRRTLGVLLALNGNEFRDPASIQSFVLITNGYLSN